MPVYRCLSSLFHFTRQVTTGEWPPISCWSPLRASWWPTRLPIIFAPVSANAISNIMVNHALPTKLLFVPQSTNVYAVSVRTPAMMPYTRLPSMRLQVWPGSEPSLHTENIKENNLGHYADLIKAEAALRKKYPINKKLDCFYNQLTLGDIVFSKYQPTPFLVFAIIFYTLAVICIVSGCVCSVFSIAESCITQEKPVAPTGRVRRRSSRSVRKYPLELGEQRMYSSRGQYPSIQSGDQLTYSIELGKQRNFGTPQNVERIYGAPAPDQWYPVVLDV